MKHDTRLVARLYATSRLEATLLNHMLDVGLMPAHEYRFHPPRRWRFDFAFPDQKIAVECEGGIYSNGWHVRGSSFEKDAEKYNQAAIDDWLVLRFTSRMIKSGEALKQIESVLEKDGTG